MRLRPSHLAPLAALAVLACQRQSPMGAEAAAQAADQPKPVLSAVTPQPAPVPSAQDFASQAAASDAFEISAAQLAQQKAKNPAVRGFASMMLHDHADSTDLLKKAVGEAGQTLTASGQPSADQKAQLAALSAADPQGFDKAYMQGQIQAHQQALAVLQSYAQNGDAPSLKAFAGGAAATVQQHLTVAKSLAEQLP